MKKVKVVIIGAGSASFGRGSIADLMASKELKNVDLTMILVDIDKESLNRMFRFANLLKEHYGNKAKIEAMTDRRQALAGANYVIIAIAEKRRELWNQDFFVPNSFGFRQTYGENGGPGAAFHTLRSIHLILPICKDIEELCPNALLLNFSNPESRVCLAISKLTHISTVGLCHGVFSTLHKVAEILGRKKDEIEISIGGINHFHWVLQIRDKVSGKSLYQQFHRKMKKQKKRLDPLSYQMYRIFGLLPFPEASHIGEYVSFSYEICGPMLRGLKIPLENVSKDDGLEDSGYKAIQDVVEGKMPLSNKLLRPTEELAIPIICDIEFDRKRRELSVNVPNKGLAISNLPEEAIVEVPAEVDANGIHPILVGPLPEAIAAMCRTQISIQELLVKAYKESSKKYLLQALLLEPAVDSVERAEKMIEEFFRVETEFLPELDS